MGELVLGGILAILRSVRNYSDPHPQPHLHPGQSDHTRSVEVAKWPDKKFRQAFIGTPAAAVSESHSVVSDSLLSQGL